MIERRSLIRSLFAAPAIIAFDRLMKVSPAKTDLRWKVVDITSATLTVGNTSPSNFVTFDLGGGSHLSIAPGQYFGFVSISRPAEGPEVSQPPSPPHDDLER